MKAVKRQENREMVDSVSLYGLAGGNAGNPPKEDFATKREAEEWLRNFLITQKADFDMKFEEFFGRCIVQIWRLACGSIP